MNPHVVRYFVWQEGIRCDLVNRECRGFDHELAVRTDEVRAAALIGQVRLGAAFLKDPEHDGFGELRLVRPLFELPTCLSVLCMKVLCVRIDDRVLCRHDSES